MASLKNPKTTWARHHHQHQRFQQSRAALRNQRTQKLHKKKFPLLCIFAYTTGSLLIVALVQSSIVDPCECTNKSKLAIMILNLDTLLGSFSRSLYHQLFAGFDLFSWDDSSFLVLVIFFFCGLKRATLLVLVLLVLLLVPLCQIHRPFQAEDCYLSFWFESFCSDKKKDALLVKQLPSLPQALGTRFSSQMFPFDWNSQPREGKSTLFPSAGVNVRREVERKGRDVKNHFREVICDYDIKTKLTWKLSFSVSQQCWK